MALTTAQIQQAYVTFFSRPADPVGLAYWQAYTGSVADLYATFAQQTEYSAAFSGLTSAQKVNVVYQNLFGRDAEATGLLYWAGKVESGAITVANLALAVSAGSQGTDLDTVNSRVSAATSFSAALDTPAEILGYTGATANAAAKTWLAGVKTAANLATAVAAIDTATAAVVAVGGAAGSTFTLTTGVDTFTGTAQADTFSALSNNGAAGETLNASDVLVGGAGVDTLNLTVTATDAAALHAATISGIEIINVRAGAAAVTATVDASTAVGATQVNAYQGAGAVTVTNLATGAAIGVIGNGTVTNGAVTYGYATATDANIINVSGGTKVATNVSSSTASPTTVTINSTGAANSLGTVDVGTGTNVTSLTVNAATDLTATLAADYAAAGAALVVTGAGKVNVGSVGTFKTVDASGNTGGLTMAIDTVTTSFKGSTANDTITTVTLAAPAAGIIDAGAGTGDKLVVAAAADVATSALRGSYTNFEVLSNASGASIAADGFTGIASVETSSDAGGFTALSAAQAANIALTTSQTGAVTYALTNSTGTSDVIGLTLGSGTTTSAATNIAGALVVTGFETLNLVANPGPTATVGANKLSTIASLTGATLKAVNMTGSAVAITNGATTVATTFDASALTGDGTVAGANGLTIGGSLVAGSTVTGSSFIDTVTIGAIGSTYNTGAGADSITASQTVILGSTINAGAGTDTLTVSDTGTVTIADNTFSTVTGVEKLALAATTGLTFAVGGYANSIATTNAGVLDITAAALATTAGVTIDATGLSAGNSLKLTLTQIDAAANASAFAITESQGADNIKITSSGAGNTDTYTITGGAAALASTVAKTVDLSGIATGGAIAVTTGAGNDVIKAAAIAGTYTGGKGSDTFTAGAGVDTFAMGTNGSIAGTDLDVIISYGAAADILTFGANSVLLAADATALVAGANVQTSAGGLVTFAAADNTLALKIAAVQADTQLDAAGSVAVFNDGGNAYVYYAGAAIGNADDMIIQLTGITAASIAAGATTIVS